MEKKKSAKKTMTFEDALEKLEEITNSLEGGELGLEESIQEFEKGIKLAKFCHDTLEKAERKIEILQKGGDGEITAKPVKARSDTGEIEDDDELQGSLL